MKFRDLTASEIDCRVQSIKDNENLSKRGVVLLLYKDARCDMNILDETVGAECWQREHYECKGNLFCRVGICVETKKGDAIFPEWVWKADCGTESNAEKEKGEASDSFKRACFNWGIGRELYTAPFIWVGADKCTITETKKGLVCYDKFEVAQIEIENKRITTLAIWNKTKQCWAFAWKEQKNGGQ